jgi:long-chain acyl-CoA synthetase
MMRRSAMSTLPRVLLERLERDAAREIILCKRDGRWVGETGAQALAKVRSVAAALLARGVKRGDRVGIIGETRAEWALCDLAILSVGACTVGVYTTSTADQAQYILDHAGVRLAFHDSAEHRAKLGPAREAVGFAELEAFARSGDVHLAADPGAFDRAVAAVAPDDLATIIYTSGTTGPPKGAMLTHRNLCAVIEATRHLFPLGPEDIGVAFLPMAHSLQRVAGYGAMAMGVRGAFAESIEKLPENWREIQPTVQASVPRIWEKVYVKAQQKLGEASPLRRKLFAWALGVGRRMAEYRKRGAERFAPLELRAQHAVADRLVFTRIRALFGGKVRFLTSGGAPISIDLLEFFYALGILILEGYGLTETAAPATLNTPDAFRFGTVGRAIPGVEIQIDPADGEVLVRGPNVFKGYWKDEAATREVFAADGFFRTGDIGELDADGYLRITDRKKSLIVTSAGKKIAPANVEFVLKRHSPLISQVYAHGDRRSYLVALITLDPEEAARAGAEAEVARAVAAGNQELARYEQVKRWKVLPAEFAQEDGLLTPTMKQKRKAIAERYAAEIEALYAQGAPVEAGA